MLMWSTTDHRETDSRTALGQVLCPLDYLQVWPSWIQNLEYLIHEISDKLQRKVPQKRESIRTWMHEQENIGRDSISLGFGSAMNRIDWGISHVITGKLIIQKTLNRHHLTCRSWFVWKMKYGKGRRKKTKSSWRNMLKSRPTTKKGCVKRYGGRIDIPPPVEKQTRKRIGTE